MARKKAGSLKGMGMSIFFDSDKKTESSEFKNSKSSKWQTVEMSESPNSGDNSGFLTRYHQYRVSKFQNPKRLKVRKRSQRMWQRTIYLTDEEEKILLGLKSLLLDKGVETEYSEIVGRALQFLWENR